MRFYLVSAAAALLFAATASAQTTFATLTGSVTDPNGAVIAGAQVTATATDSNYQYTAKSNDVGIYTIGQLLEGSYNLKVESPGFKTFLARDVRLAAQQ